ncbi:MAG: hypothetical protein RLP02_12930 [Coleofasciculus sp. C2-GNP5-27]
MSRLSAIAHLRAYGDNISGLSPQLLVLSLIGVITRNHEMNHAIAVFSSLVSWHIYSSRHID